MARKLKYRRTMRSGLIGLVRAADLGVPVPRQRSESHRMHARRSGPSVDRVTVAATVRTRRGTAGREPQAERTSSCSTPAKRRTITDFKSDAAPVSVALLVDFSGSMGVGERRVPRATPRRTSSSCAEAGMWTRPGSTSSTRQLRELQPIAPAPGDILAQLESMSRPFGATSLFDAIAETGRVLASTRRHAPRGRRADRRRGQREPAHRLGSVGHRQQHRRAGLHRRRRLAARSVGQDDDRRPAVGRRAAAKARSPISRAGRAAKSIVGVGPAQSSSTRPGRSSSELRQQYLIAFEPDGRPGWHPIELRTRDKDHVVRARSGYIVQAASGRGCKSSRRVQHAEVIDCHERARVRRGGFVRVRDQGFREEARSAR